MEQQKEPIVIPYKIEMTREMLIRFQVIFMAFINGVYLTPQDINTLTLLGLKGEQPLLPYCKELVGRKLFTSIQSSRNTISKLHKKGFLIKKGTSKKRISLLPTICTIHDNTVLINIQCLYDTSEN